MATRRNSTDDPLAPLTLAVGQEDLLLDRAVKQVVAAARASDADTDVRDLTSDQLQPGTLAELTSPSLFAERKVVIVRNAQDLSADTVKDVKAYLGAPVEEITLVLLHAGGAKGKALLDAARKAGAREVACPKTTKPAERLSFVRSEFRALGRSASPEACQALVDSIGSDLRELASAVSRWSRMSRARSTKLWSGATTPVVRRRPASPSPTGRWRGGRRRRWRRCAGRCRPGWRPC